VHIMRVISNGKHVTAVTLIVLSATHIVGFVAA
jgi:hypothetical protein